MDKTSHIKEELTNPFSQGEEIMKKGEGASSKSQYKSTVVKNIEL